MEIFFTRGSNSKGEVFSDFSRNNFFEASLFLTVLTFLICWIWFAIYFHYKLLLSALCSNSVFSNVSLCLSLCYIEAFAVRDITWVVTTWLVFMAAVSGDIWSNQPHASGDTAGLEFFSCLLIQVSQGLLAWNGTEITKPFLFQLLY